MQGEHILRGGNCIHPTTHTFRCHRFALSQERWRRHRVQGEAPTFVAGATTFVCVLITLVLETELHVALVADNHSPGIVTQLAQFMSHVDALGVG